MKTSYRNCFAIVALSVISAVVLSIIWPKPATATTCVCGPFFKYGIAPGDEEYAERNPDMYCNCVPRKEFETSVKYPIYFTYNIYEKTYGIRSIEAVQKFNDGLYYFLGVFSASVGLLRTNEESWSSEQELVSKFYPSPARVKSLFRWRNKYGKPWSTVVAYSGSIRTRLVRHAANSNLGLILGRGSHPYHGWIQEFYGRLIRHVADPVFEDEPYEFRYEEHYKGENVFRKYFSDWLRRHVSEYAAVSLRTAFTECFALFMSDKPESKGLPESISKLFKDMISGKYPDYFEPREDIKKYYEERWAPPMLALIRESNRNPEALLRKEPSAILGHELLAYDAYMDMQK